MKVNRKIEYLFTYGSNPTDWFELDIEVNYNYLPNYVLNKNVYNFHNF